MYRKLDSNAYLGPVQPIVVPRPPLSFSTTSLSNSFFVSTESASKQILNKLLMLLKSNQLTYIKVIKLNQFSQKKKRRNFHRIKIATIRRGCQALIRNHYFISRGLDLTPFHMLRFTAVTCITS